jgi:UDP-N-acetylmuramate dehydrogenase
MNWYRGFESFVKENEPLAQRTTYKVGGPARWFAQPPDAESLWQLLTRAAQEALPLKLLGHGTNLLVADGGVNALVIKLPRNGFGWCQRSASLLEVGGGHSLPALVNWSVARGLLGMECLHGVPGTVGAALRMNAGGKHGEICNVVRRVYGFEMDGRPFDYDAKSCGFVYRGSGLAGRIVTGCQLELHEGDAEAAKRVMKDILADKCRTQPVDARSAGCVFKNPKLPGVAPAGKLIDELGLKGTEIGGAQVSTLHANFLVCHSGARADDLVNLIRLIRDRIQDERGVLLDLEVETWGFEAEELLPQREFCAA